MDQLLGKLQEIFRDIFDDEDLAINKSTTADDVEDWDSLTHMQLIITIEKKYGVKFTTDEVMNTKNVGDFIKLLESKLG